MANIKRYAYWLQVISVLFAMFLFGEICYRWLFFSEASTFWAEIYTNVSYSFGLNWLKELTEMSFLQRLSGFAVDTLGLVILCLGILALQKLLKLLKSQLFFNGETVKLLNNLSKIALGWTIYNPVRVTLLSLITTLHKGVGKRVISLEFGLKDMVNIFIFASMILISVLLQEGLKLKKEQDLTI